MALSSLIIYEPLDTLSENRDYWREYVFFYEQYWGGPTSPYGVWFGTEYNNFRNALSKHLEIDEEDIVDCFFMKDKDGKHYISPFTTGINPYILHSENYIPLYWFLLFKHDEGQIFYTPWGFGGINYDTRINLGSERLKEADEIVQRALREHKEARFRPPILQKLHAVQAGIQSLKAWLGGFDPSGYVVLNYGEICSFIHPYTMKNERSVNEIWQMLNLVKEGRLEEAQSVLNIMVEKWEDIKRKASGDIDKSTVQ
ncbi:MAG TPA: hypothetical protein VGA94_00575 [Thermodesulfobacteriota bacterium]|jgi:hypothetical protein